MAARSSTSSSEHGTQGPLPNEDDAPLAAVRGAAGRRAFPRALVLAVALVLLFEIALRGSGWPKHFPYELGRMEYGIAAAQIERAGAAEVSIVGSSRTRESIVVPLMAQRLTERLGRPVSVANYASSGAYTTDFEATTKRLLRATPKPKVILIGISERDLIYAGRIWDEVGPFRNVDDLRESIHERGVEGLEELPVMIRSSIGRRWRTLGLRDMLRFEIVAQLTSTAVEPFPSPAEGGLSIWQRTSPSRNLAKKPIKKSRVLERSAAFRFEQFPHTQLGDSLDDLMSACDEAGVPLVIYEVHQSKALRDALPKGFYKRFTDFVHEHVGRHGDRFVRLEDLKLKLNDADMREPSHMSFRGASKLTEALADQVVTPMLRGDKKRKKPATTTTTTTVSSPGTP